MFPYDFTVFLNKYFTLRIITKCKRRSSGKQRPKGTQKQNRQIKTFHNKPNKHDYKDKIYSSNSSISFSETRMRGPCTFNISFIVAQRPSYRYGAVLHTSINVGTSIFFPTSVPEAQSTGYSFPSVTSILQMRARQRF